MEKPFILFSGSSHNKLTKAIASILEVELGNIYLSKFSCGENYARIEETVRGFDTFVIQTCTENINDDLMELFLIIDALHRSSAKTVNVIMPHYGYARQDKKSAPREPISARVVADLLKAVGINRLVTLDLHAGQIQGFYTAPMDHMTAMPLFIDYFEKKKLQDLVVVAPDAGRAKFAKKLGDKLHAELAIMHKTRPNHNQAEITNIVGDVKGKTVLLVDDMVDTGGSVTSSLTMLRNYGCNKDIYLATTHAVFSGPATERLKKAGLKEVVVTDTIPIPKNKQFDNLKIISVAPLLAEVIRRNVTRQSISLLYEQF